MALARPEVCHHPEYNFVLRPTELLAQDGSEIGAEALNVNAVVNHPALLRRTSADVDHLATDRETVPQVIVREMKRRGVRPTRNPAGRAILAGQRTAARDDQRNAAPAYPPPYL